MWPKEWSNSYTKAYPRFPTIDLPALTSSPSPFTSVLQRRESRRDFDAEKALKLNELAYVLSGIARIDVAGGESDLCRRPYPSAGARYPVETYLLPLQVCGLDRHVHHFYIRTNQFSKLWEIDTRQLEETFAYQEAFLRAHALVVFTTCFDRSAMKYSERSYRYALIEAGHAAQNICLLAASANLICCPIGGFCDEPLIDLLGVDPNEELPIYCLALGHAS
jgi:SagB-type dehydrogenase family enzyme